MGGVHGGMTVRRRFALRRTLVLGTACIAVLSGGATVVVYVLTGAPPDAAPPVVEASDVPAPQAAAGATPYPRVDSPMRGGMARAPHPAAVPHPPDDPPRTSVGAPARRATEGIKVSFKMDPRVTKSLHMGTRWVSPQTYVGTHRGNLFTVQARAHGADARRAFSDATWLSAEPDMVAVTPDAGGEIEIVVLREGRSTLTVAGGGARRTLTLSAVQRDGVWRVDISQ